MGRDQIYSGVGSVLPSTHSPTRAHTQTSQVRRSPTKPSEKGRSKLKSHGRSALGHSRPSHLALALNNVCFAPKTTIVHPGRLAPAESVSALGPLTPQ
jgi:hypothetical protein